MVIEQAFSGKEFYFLIEYRDDTDRWCDSSPHLVEVRERIRINGEMISKEKFVDYFWKCYQPIADEVHKSQEDGNNVGRRLGLYRSLFASV